MSATTAIQWTEKTWNPVTGCDQVSPGCDNCYAKTLAKRLQAMGSARYQTDGDPRTSGPGFGVAVHPEALGEPLRWRKPSLVFVNSMSDLFHADIPDEYIARVFAVMALAPQHTFQVLTKRHARMRSLLSSEDFRAEVAASTLIWTVREDGSRGVDDEHLADAEPDWWPLPNVWLGVSVEDQKWADIRIPALLGTPAAVRFLSCEPLLGPVDLSAHLVSHAGHELVTVDGMGPFCRTCTRSDENGEPFHPILRGTRGIDWVIVGGESGPGARPMHPDWARSLRYQCQAAGVPFFFKQWGGRTPKAGGRLLDGRTWDEMPEVTR